MMDVRKLQVTGFKLRDKIRYMIRVAGYGLQVKKQNTLQDTGCELRV